jgi:protein-disulfide isomerase
MRALLRLCVPSLLAAVLTACTASGDQAKPTDTAKKPDPVDTPVSEVPVSEQIRDIEGVDLKKLSEGQRESFFAVINQESSACGQAHSLAKSLQADPDCRDSVLVAQFIADRLGAGMTPMDIRQQLDGLLAALKPVEIDLEGRPVFGNPSAPVTVVVWADFQCPLCKSEAPHLREEVSNRRGQAKLVFKHFPLEGHPRGEPAAIAVEAAHLQGKFWEMHDLVFANQSMLEDEDLESYAQQIEGLDLAKWKADVTAETTKAAVSRDRGEGKVLKIGGTPTVFVNGRLVTPALWDGELSAWIDDALRR